MSPDDAIVSDVSDRAAFDLRDDGFVNAANRAMVGLIVVEKWRDGHDDARRYQVMKPG